jgi:hypothetical protein
MVLLALGLTMVFIIYIFPTETILWMLHQIMRSYSMGEEEISRRE